MNIIERLGILILGIILWKLFMWNFDKSSNRHDKRE